MGDQLLQFFFSGITVGSIYAVVAIGFNIIYNSTGIINFAQGEFVMLGGMTAYSLSAVLPLFLAIALSVLITAAFGSVVELVFIRRIRKPTVLKMIIVTIGLSILIREAALHIWDEKVRALRFFTGSEISSLRIFGARISPQVLWVLGATLLISGGLFVFFRYTLAGRAMRACSENRTAARLCGIKTARVINLSFILSAAIGALAGCVISPLTQTRHDMGSDLAIKGFTVAILGGLGNSPAALAAGLLLGLLESYSIGIVPMAFKDVVAISVLLLVLVLKPSGLFSGKQAAGLREF